VELRIPGSAPVTISSLSWIAGPADAGVSASAPGEAVQQPEPAITATGALTCQRASTFGSASQIGTPGAANESCFEYRMDRIPVAYEDVSSGTALFTMGVSNDDVFTTVPLSVPFRYFGAEQSTLTVSTNGWVAFTTQTSSWLSNRLVPSATSQPVGAIAIMWDDLASSFSPFPDANVYWKRVGDRFIVQWHHSTHLSAGDNMNFQIKLFDNGVIELHYGTMVNGAGTSRYAEGGSATAWLERPDGSALLPIIRNSSATMTGALFIAPDSAYRFTPKN
jgi:hypothetical protein